MTSDAITERLNDVRDAMDEMQEKAAAYGASFTYEMHPETNFQITYDYFDWTTFSAYETGKPNGAYLGFDYTTAYGGDNPQLTAARQGLPGETHVNGSENDPLFSSIQSASVRLTGEKAQNIQLNRNGNETSAYTQFLKNKYHVDSVIYLVHFNAESQPQTFFQDMDEFSVICDMRTSNVKNNIKHETAHLFGAYDYYENSYVPETVTHFAYSYFGTELMLSNGTAISPVTAFSIGWLDRLNNATYQTFFG